MHFPGIEQRWFREVEKTTEFVTLMDSSERLLYVNHPQPGSEDYVGRAVFDFVDPACHDSLRQAVGRVRETGMPEHYDSRAPGPDGEVSSYSNWVIALPGPAEERIIAFVATDVSQRGRIEAELELSETTLRSLVDNSPDSILIVDRDRRIVFINRLEHGFELEQILGVRAESFVPERDRGKVVAAVDHVLATGGTTSYEIELDAPHGVRRFSTRVAPIPRDGKIDRIMLVATDITAQFEAEQEHQRMANQLRQAQKMEAIGQLTGGIAHDFNNLLTAISGNLELMRADAGDAARTELHVREALEAVQRASTLTQRLLAYSRKQALRPQAVDAHALIDGMQSLLQRTLGETIEVRTPACDGLWMCAVDPGQLENAILNLAVNARDAMPRGGELVIRSSNFTADARSGVPRGDHVLIEVIDNGAGMEPEIVSRAFEPFFTTKDVGRGSGLGLSMVYGFVRQSGGHVQIHSQPGVGTAVEIYLPARNVQAPALPRSKVEVEVAAGEGELILVVEDDEHVRSMTALVLQRRGYRTREAENARAALESLADDPEIALLLSDVVLPGGMDGFELADQAQGAIPGLPVLFVSGYPQHALSSPERLRWIDRVLEKPFTTEQLTQAVRRALTEGRGASATGRVPPRDRH